MPVSDEAYERLKNIMDKVSTGDYNLSMEDAVYDSEHICPQKEQT